MPDSAVLLSFLPSRTFAVRATFVLVLLAGFLWFMESRRNDFVYEYPLIGVATTPKENARITNEDIDRLVTETLSEIEFERGKTPAIPAFETPSADASRLAVIKNPSIPDIRGYGSSLASVISKLYTGDTGLEAAVLIDAIQTPEEQPKNRSALVAQVAKYRQARANLDALAVPESALLPHLNLSNALSRIGELVLQMSAFGIHEAGALIAAQSFQTEQAGLSEIFASINAYFAGLGIEFGATERANIVIILPEN